MKNKEFFEALKLMEKEKGIPAEFLAEKIANAIVVAERRDYDGLDIVHCDIDTEKEKIDVYVTKEVVDEIDPEHEKEQIILEDALKHSKRAVVGGTVNIKLNTKNFGRIVAQTAKHVIRQGIREAEHGMVLEEFQSKNSEIVSATVTSIDPVTENATLKIGKSDAILPRSEQVPNETLTEGQIIKVYIVDVRETEKGPKIMISRTHPGFVKRLFEMEVPEIFDGVVEIKAVSREAGARTKMAVFSKDENVDP
ncbi:MAG: NusA N-terminal domain-containing protein, partial [Acutalibacteraceae bacterium]